MRVRGPREHPGDRYPLTWQDWLRGLVYATAVIIATFFVTATVGTFLRLEPYRVAFITVGCASSIFGAWWPPWFRRWLQIDFWRGLLGDRGARIFVIGTGLVAIMLGLPDF